MRAQPRDGGAIETAHERQLPERREGSVARHEAGRAPEIPVALRAARPWDGVRIRPVRDRVCDAGVEVEERQQAWQRGRAYVEAAGLVLDAHLEPARAERLAAGAARPRGCERVDVAHCR